MLCLTHLIQFVSQFLLYFLKYKFFLCHLTLYIFKFLGEILARVLPLASYLSLSSFKVRYFGSQLSSLTVLSIHLLFH
jgi:hypothetical protein